MPRSRSRVWQFLRDPKNLAVLIALGGVLAFVWRDIVAPRLNEQKSAGAPAPTQAVKAASPQPVPAQSPPLSPPAEAPQQQIATASGGGVAINASGDSHVEVNPDRAPKK
jgi:hypothetical protein